MPKPKRFLHESNKKSKHAKAVPTTADEYLEAGVDFEDAGGKWRVGDAAKATRFFTRAIDCYEEGMKKFPLSFDLAYNKARVQFELTQHPKLLWELHEEVLDLLKAALESSRYALKLDPENADVLFNTAQVLTSLTEALSDEGEYVDPFPLLEEALDLFQRCLSHQEAQKAQSAAFASEALEISQNQQVSETTVKEDLPVKEEKEVETEERWASIVEPVTNETLLDTVLAQLETLTLSCTLIPSFNVQAIQNVAAIANPIIDTKINEYSQGTDRVFEASLTRANFTCALANAQFQANLISVEAYTESLDLAYQGLDLTGQAEGLCDKADALVAYSSALRHIPDKSILGLRWTALSTALSNLATASTLSAVPNLAKVHLARGDAELFRYQLGQPSPADPNVHYEPAEKNANVLLNNAEKFYRGAGAVASNSDFKIEVFEAQIKEMLVKGFKGSTEEILKAWNLDNARRALGGYVEEGLVTENQLVAMGVGE